MKRSIILVCVIYFCFSLLSLSVSGQSDTSILNGNRFFDLSIEQLMNVQVDVATLSAENIRETQGVVTVVTQAEMLHAGARDLKEVLSTFVPGMDFGVDVEGVVGVGFRGIWGNEGKVLLLIDGIEVNEELFATLQFGGHYPVDMIEKVEVIRGPGSAVYGGYAGLAVINVITKASGQVNGTYGAFLNSYSKDAVTHSDMSFGHTQDLGPVKISFSGTEGKGSRATRTWYDSAGKPVKLASKSDIRVSNYNALVAFKGFSVRGMVDLYRPYTANLWGTAVSDRAFRQKFDSYFGEIKYTCNVNSRLKVTPSFQVKQQYPWQLEVPAVGYRNSRYSNKLVFSLNSTYELSENAHLLVGGEAAQCKILGEASDILLDESSFSVINISGYGQLSYSTKWVNFTFGGRFDRYNHYGSSFVPRFGITKAWSDFNFKLMASQSFRVPGGVIPKRNLLAGKKVDPEMATNFELEIGYHLSQHSWITVNGYQILFNKVIVYSANPLKGVGSYSNEGKQGTYGVEADFRYASDYVDFRMNYAYYVAENNESENYVVPNHSEAFPAFANHRVNAVIGFNVSKSISITPTILWYGERYGYVPNYNIAKKFDPETLVNITVSATGLLVQGLDVYVGAHNILDKNVPLIQPYNGGHPALPGESASIFARLVFHF